MSFKIGIIVSTSPLLFFSTLNSSTPEISNPYDFKAAIASADTVGTVLGCMVYPPNFMIGQLRATMTEAGTDIINQKRVLVSSRRFGFQDIISGAGAVNLEFTSA